MAADAGWSVPPATSSWRCWCSTAWWRAPYYFLDPQSVGTAAVVGNIGLLAAIFLVLGYILVAVGRSTAAAGVDTG